ncbi:hypothetical protein FLAG1_06209 [Fusarium langsethiae]|uniref:Ankyrin repeat protein n=1 Tax=Fusarium langsethiae TaxID=179993 RepID=A0A0N0DEB8_FUSLA|nr:hypothetical protein FLAG1_06209 [Fusarium langsethiae]
MSSSALLKTIRSLKDSTFEACAAISAYSKSSLSASKSSETDSKASKIEIKHLLVELRLLGGSLYSLESFVTELTADNDISGDSTLGITPSASDSPSGNGNDREWPMIDKCEILVSALKSFHAYATSDGIKAARASLSDVRSKLAFVLGSSDTLEEISLQFSILTTDSVPQLMVQKESDYEAVETPDHVYEDDEPSTTDVSDWLTILNSSENDREPAEYNRETMLIQARRITEPKYRVAAARWPEYAEKHWQTLRPQVCTLFRIQKSYSFVQWVLEYSRVTYPRTLGSLAFSPRLLLELTDALCDGSVSSLHIAAALGLPNLCRDLLSMGAKVNQSSLIGTPLFCALVGSKVLATRTEPESWATLLVGGDSNVDQAATILFLIDGGADCKYRYSWKNGTEEVSLAGLAFWTALISKHEDVFTRIAKGGGNLDRSFYQLLQRETLTKRGLLHRARFARLLTYVYDMTLLDIERETTEYAEIQDLVSKVMRHTKVKFLPTTDGKIDTLSDGSFAEAIRTAVLDFNVALVERLTKDPRFDPNFPYDNDGTSGTILHMATEGAQLEIMDILIRAGADVRARDSSGRTPLMVIEEVGPLAKLILEHSAPTYDTDKGGRNIWHLLAATNDVKLLMYLWDNDPFKIRNLDAICEDGHTPLRAAFAYVKTLEGLPKSSKRVGPWAAQFMLHQCQGYLKAEGNEQLARWAIEWGDAHLVQKIFQLIPSANTGDELLLRSLNISAGPKLVSLVLDKAGPSRPFSNGLTPAETVITNTKLLRQRLGFTTKPSLHPSCFPEMTRAAYMDLLTPEVLRSRDHLGRGLWARFCDDVLSMLDSPSADHPTNMYFLYGFARMAISCLLHKGALLDHEKETGEWAISRISKKSQVGPVTWTASKLPFVAAVLEASWDEVENPEGRAKAGSKEFFDTRDAAVLLSLAVRSRKPEVVVLLVQSGINVHKPWESFGGRSIFEDFLADEPVDVSMIMPLLSNTKPQDIIANQHYTFREILSIPDEAIALDILEELIDCGMDINSLEVTNQPSFRSPIHDSPGPSMLVKALCRSRTDIARLLVRRGADASLAPPDSISGFMLVAKIGFVVVLEAIIEKAPADFNWLCRFNAFEHGDVFNALQFAAVGGHRDVLMTLLEATPLAEEIDTVSPRYGRSPAHLAAKAGSLDCIKVLTRFGANLTLKDSSGRTPLFYALLGPDREVAEYIEEHMPDPNSTRNIILPPSMPESPGASSDISSDVNMADASSVDENSEPRRLGDLMAHAIDHYQMRRDALFKPFLDHASKKDLESAIMPCRGCTLLSYTASKNLVRPMLELLDLGFKGFVTGCEEHWDDGYNAILQAARDIQPLMAFDMFISPEKAYSFFEKCLDAYLHEERIWFHLRITPIHALFDLKQAVPQSSLNLEHQYKVLQIFIKHLTEHAEQYWTLIKKSGLLSTFRFSENESIVKRVLRFVMNLRTKPDIDGEGINGATPLHSMIRYCGRKEPTTSQHEMVCNVAKLLIDSGADVNVPDGAATRPLHLAVDFRLLPLIDVLLEAGADQDVRDYQGISPLGRSFMYGSLDMTRRLVEHGGNLATLAVNPLNDFENSLSVLHELLALGLDPFSIILPSYETTLTSMLSRRPDSRCYALNGDFDFYRLAEEEPSFLRSVFLGRFDTHIQFKAVIKRIPRECRARIVNFEPDHGLNAGCLAILSDLRETLELYLEAGFDVDREWRGRGSALMYASSVGAFECFKLLIHCGAKISYLGTGKRGEPVIRSAAEEAKRHPKLLQWLLVDRYYETKYLMDKEHNGPNIVIKPWSGPRKAAYRLSGTDEEYPWLDSEPMIYYAERISMVRENLEGLVLPVTLVE